MSNMTSPAGIRYVSSSVSSFFFDRRIVASLMLAYPLLVRLLRYRRSQQLEQKFAAYTNNPSTMTFEDARHIFTHLAQYEFPFTFEKALQFALFRTYGIPTISGLLLKTSLLSSRETASKRYADTAVLIADVLDGDWGEERWREGIARINSIHGPYKAAGSISNDDMLYTLSLFAGELPRWCKRFEWRELTPLELCALGVNWKGIGDGMEISYEVLPSASTGWRDGSHWLEEVVAWAAAYEARFMVPNKGNHSVAEQTTAILLWSLPEFAKPVARQAVYSLMDERLRDAMLYPAPSPTISKIVLGGLQVRKYFLKYLTLPRWMPWRTVTETKSKHGTYYLLTYESLPYYVKPTAWNRWLSPGALLQRLRGLPLPGDKGQKYYPEGYTTVKAGPNHGKGSQAKMEAALGPLGERRCPMAFGK